MNFKENLYKIYGWKGIENLDSFLGSGAGKLIFDTLYEAERLDKELDVVHRCLVDLYNHSDNSVGDRVKKCLYEIETLKSKK